jgi:hypothetical protein
MGPPPKVDPYRVRDQQLQEAANARAEAAANKPNLPAGYEMGPDGTARLIPGLPGPQQGGNAVNSTKLAAKRAALTSLEAQINRVDDLYTKGFKDESLGLLSSLSEYLPTNDAAALNTAGAGLAEQGLAAFRVPGVGSQSDTELRQFVEANRPSSWDRDVAVEEKLKQLRTRVDATRAEMGLPPAQWRSGAASPETTDAGQVVHDGNLGGETLQRSTNGYETVDNPKLAGVRGEYLRRLERGDSAGSLVNFLRSAGVTDSGVFRTAAKQAQFRRANPNVPIDKYNTSALDDMDVPLSGVEESLNAAAQTAPGAYAMRAGQALPLNTLDDMAPNQERAQIALDDAGNANPVASTLGDLSGGVLAALGGEAGLARLGIGAGIGRAAAADTLYGAGAGAGASEDNRLGGAATGALAGLVGSLAGQGLTAGIGKMVGGVSDPSVRAVVDQQVPVTLGQAVGQSGVLGRMVKSTEDRLAGFSGVGDVINARRTEGIHAMNAKAFDKALEPIGATVGGKIGEDAVGEAQSLVSEAFTRALSGKVAGVDRQFITEATAAKNAIKGLPRLGGEVESSIDEVVNAYFDPATGTINGENMQALLQELGAIKRGYAGDPLGHRVGKAISKVEDAVENLFRRQTPEVIPQYESAKKAFRRLSIIEDAVLRAKNKGGVFTPGQLGMADRTNAKKFSGTHAAAAGKGEFHDFQRPMQEVLPNEVPDSGTAGRVAMMAVPAAIASSGAGVGYAAGDAQTGAGVGLGLAGLLALAYSRRGQGLITAAVAKRGAGARAVGKKIKDRSRLLGASGATVAVQGTSPDR